MPSGWVQTALLHSGCLLFQLLAKLLKSKNPDDLQEANKLIKSMVKEVSGPWALGLGHSSSPETLGPSCSPAAALSCRDFRRSLVSYARKHRGVRGGAVVRVGGVTLKQPGVSLASALVLLLGEEWTLWLLKDKLGDLLFTAPLG